MNDNKTECPCGSGKTYPKCCGPYLAGEAQAPTAVALMRSRYTAYVRGDGPYLLRTWHSRTRPPRIDIPSELKWLGLEVRHTEAGGPDDSEGRVEFVARSKLGGRAQRLHEVSRFLREDGHWRYLDGEILSPRPR